MSVPRFCHTATLLTDDTALIAGGLEREGMSLASAEVFDPATQTFRTLSPMTTERACHSATLLPDGKVLLAGGLAGRRFLAEAEVYDPQTGSFTTTGAMQTARYSHIAVLLEDGKVLVAGGSGQGETSLDSAELYDPATGTFAATGALTVARAAHAATRLNDGRVLVTGGGQGRGDRLQVYASAELYDPATGTFVPAGDMTARRHKHAAVLLPGGQVLVVGGSDEHDWDGRYRSAEIYNPSTDTFSATGGMNFARFKLLDAVTPMADGSVLVAGGDSWVETFSPATQRFDIVESPLDTARFFSTATLLADGRVLILGGYDSNIRATAGAWMYAP
jgi:hypothetical protein